MVKYFVLISMIFCHTIADYNLQGWLASAKQKEWWEKNAPQKLYKYDYIAALIMHSISWTFMIMLPIAIDMKFNIDFSFIAWFIVNTCCHAIVDNDKANRKTINLLEDQSIHMVQIVFTFLFIV